MRVGWPQVLVARVGAGALEVALDSETEGVSAAGVEVVVRTIDAHPGSAYRRVHSDRDGLAFFPYLPPGEYVISTGYLGDGRGMFAPVSARVSVEDSTEQVVLKLLEAPVLRVELIDGATGHFAVGGIALRVPGVGMARSGRFVRSFHGPGPHEIALPVGEVKVIARSETSGWGAVTVNLLPGEVASRRIVLGVGADVPSLSIECVGPAADEVRYVQVIDVSGGAIVLLESGTVEVESGLVAVGEPVDGRPSVSNVAALQSKRFLISAIPVGHYVIRAFGEFQVLGEHELVHSRDSQVVMEVGA